MIVQGCQKKSLKRAWGNLRRTFAFLCIPFSSLSNNNMT